MSKRSTYRHTFALKERPAIDIAVSGRPPFLRGKILNLSLGGALVEVRDRARLLKEGSWVVLRFDILDGPTEYHARTIYAGSGDNAQFGFRFVRLIDPTENTSRDKALWRYLLEEQRGQIRKMKLLR
jgi:hypothetical protein